MCKIIACYRFWANMLPTFGVVGKSREVYPAVLKGGSRQPLWLRLEQNMVDSRRQFRAFRAFGFQDERCSK